MTFNRGLCRSLQPTDVSIHKITARHLSSLQIYIILNHVVRTDAYFRSEIVQIKHWSFFYDLKK